MDPSSDLSPAHIGKLRFPYLRFLGRRPTLIFLEDGYICVKLTFYVKYIKQIEVYLNQFSTIYIHIKLPTGPIDEALVLLLIISMKKILGIIWCAIDCINKTFFKHTKIFFLLCILRHLASFNPNPVLSHTRNTRLEAPSQLPLLCSIQRLWHFVCLYLSTFTLIGKVERFFIAVAKRHRHQVDACMMHEWDIS